MMDASIFQTLQENINRVKSAMASIPEAERLGVQKHLDEAQQALSTQDEAKAGELNETLGQVNPTETIDNPTAQASAQEDESIIKSNVDVSIPMPQKPETPTPAEEDGTFQGSIEGTISMGGGGTGGEIEAEVAEPAEEVESEPPSDMHLKDINDIFMQRVRG
jgi:hypothetical protein